MNLLVTGAAGFIGSHFVRLVLEDRPEVLVVVVDALTYSGNRSTMADFADRVTFHQARIQDAAAMNRIVESEGVTHIVNFAAESHNDRSMECAAEFLDTNVGGTYTLLEATRKFELAKMVHVSTDEVYGSIATGEFTESSPLEPNTLYSASKAGGDLQCRAHHRAYGTPVSITRGGNTYGPFQYPEKLIPFFVTRLIDGKKVPVYGDGSQVREWIYVRDHCAGILKVLDAGLPGEAYNVGDTNERRNMDIVRILLEETGQQDSLVKHIPDPRQGAHDARYSMRCDKLNALGWKPEHPFDETLRMTVRWYREHQPWWREVTSKPEQVEFVRRYYGPGLGEDL
ncbi:MAG: dTDP-glucose 4,6-dehydratase [Chthonomonas sp.]|nr:dTDP-glucose 4,6-dehydratase [Chthonomonas sp.]